MHSRYESIWLLLPHLHTSLKAASFSYIRLLQLALQGKRALPNLTPSISDHVAQHPNLLWLSSPYYGSFWQLELRTQVTFARKQSIKSTKTPGKEGKEKKNTHFKINKRSDGGRCPNPQDHNLHSDW